MAIVIVQPPKAHHFRHVLCADAKCIRVFNRRHKSGGSRRFMPRFSLPAGKQPARVANKNNQELDTALCPRKMPP
jgi:hypothetical protein